MTDDAIVSRVADGGPEVDERSCWKGSPSDCSPTSSHGSGHGSLIQMVGVLGPASVPRLGNAHVGWLDAAVAGVLAAGCGLVIGALPAYRAGGDALQALREGAGASMSRAALRYRQCLLGAQLALVLVLLVTAGLKLGTLRTLLGRPLGFSLDGVLVAELRVPSDQEIELAALEVDGGDEH